MQYLPSSRGDVALLSLERTPEGGIFTAPHTTAVFVQFHSFEALPNAAWHCTNVFPTKISSYCYIWFSSVIGEAAGSTLGKIGM